MNTRFRNPVDANRRYTIGFDQFHVKHQPHWNWGVSIGLGVGFGTGWLVATYVKLSPELLEAVRGFLT